VWWACPFLVGYQLHPEGATSAPQMDFATFQLPASGVSGGGVGQQSAVPFLARPVEDEVAGGGVVSPTVGGEDGGIHPGPQVAQGLDVRGTLLGVVETVVGFGETGQRRIQKGRDGDTMVTLAW
jgi:hypothetical protein